MARKAGVDYLSAGLGDGWDEALGLKGHYRDAATYLEEYGSRVVRLPLVEWHDCPSAVDELAQMVREVAAKAENTIVMLGDGQNLYRQHDCCDELRQVYRQHAGLPAQGSSNPVRRIAVHIRRGDVMRMKQTGRGDWQSRFVDVRWFADVLADVVRGLGPRPYEIEVFSQGSPEDLGELRAFAPLSFGLDTDPVWSFHRMATADVLVVSPSSYSFNAGLLNPGVKIARAPWWHEIPAGGGWIAVPAGGAAHLDLKTLVNRHLEEVERGKVST